MVVTMMEVVKAMGGEQLVEHEGELHFVGA